jgi:hypothetical protein
MDEQKAQELADEYNTALGAGVSEALYKVFAYWLPNFVKDYNITLCPAKYEADFNAATDSLKIAFQRVSTKAVVNIDSLGTYVSNYDTEAARDAELGPYLGL